MENCFPEKFAVRRVNQRVGSESLLQRRKRSAGSKEHPTSRKFHSLLLRRGCKPPDRPVSQPPRLGLHSRDEITCLPPQHLFRRVIRLPEFIRERFDEVNPLPRQNDRCALFDEHRDNRPPPRMHPQPNPRLFPFTHFPKTTHPPPLATSPYSCHAPRT